MASSLGPSPFVPASKNISPAPRSLADEMAARCSFIPRPGYSGDAKNVALVAEIPALGEAVAFVAGDSPSPGVTAAAAELVLEGLHLTRRLNKDVVASAVTYRSR